MVFSERDLGLPRFPLREAKKIAVDDDEEGIVVYCCGSDEV
jgi:hypothetical protein